MATRFITVSIDIMHDKNLTPNQKFILAEIEQLSELEKGCIATNEHFSSLIGLAKESVSRSIADLEKKGYIECEIVNGTRNHVRIIRINKMLSPPKQNVKPPLTKRQETKENIQENKTNNIKPFEIIGAYKQYVSKAHTKVAENSSMQELRLKKHDWLKIINGIKNYGASIEDEKFTMKLSNFIKDKVYLDYQEEEKQESKLEGWK